MSFQFSEIQLQTIQQMASEAAQGQGYWRVYQYIAEQMIIGGVPLNDSALLWFEGATEANHGTGAFSALIRSYTTTQARLRFGVVLTNEQIQAASDAVAIAVINDILGNGSGSIRGQVPTIEQIAAQDATEVGRTIFNAAGDTSAPPVNSAWSGALLFTLLGSDQSVRLMTTGASGLVDTVNDWRDALFAYVAYQEGIASAALTWLSESASQKLKDSAILGQTIGAYLSSSSHTVGQFWSDARPDGTTNPALNNAFGLIDRYGANALLDLLRAAVGGTPVSVTTDETFISNANSLGLTKGAVVVHLQPPSVRMTAPAVY